MTDGQDSSLALYNYMFLERYCHRAQDETRMSHLAYCYQKLAQGLHLNALGNDVVSYIRSAAILL